jgi:hypothetical protein
MNFYVTELAEKKGTGEKKGGEKKGTEKGDRHVFTLLF